MKSYGVTIMNCLLISSTFTWYLIYYVCTQNPRGITIQMRLLKSRGINCCSVCHKVKNEIFVNFDLAILNERVVVRNFHYPW